MKNKLTTFLTVISFLLLSNYTFAQNAPIDFEAGGFGADWTWTVFENDTNPPVEIIANPDPSGINTSATVAKFTALQTGQPWAGTESQHGSDIGVFTLNASNSTVKIMVWKPVISDVGIKFVLPNSDALVELKVPNTLVNQWEELTFDFSSRIDHPATIGQDQIVIFPDFDLGGRTSDNVCYFDNITFSEKSTSTSQPTTPAPTPTVASDGVISIFSDAYTPITGLDLNPNWGQATVVSQVMIEGNNTLLLAGLNYQGIDFDANHQDLTGVNTLHVDFWSSNSTVLNISVISPGPVEKAFPLTVPTNGNWTSVEIPLSSFSPVDLADVFQLKFDGNGDIYIDNIFFYQGEDVVTTPTTHAPVPTHSAENVISIFSDTYTPISDLNLNPDWGQATAVSEVLIEGNNTLVLSGLNYQGIDFDPNHQDVSGMEFIHLDYWTANSTALNIYLISPGPVEAPKALTVPTEGNWVSVDMPLADFSPVDLADVFQFKFDGNGDIYIDNLYFYKITTDVEETNELPTQYSLEQNYPNPFNPTTNISFSIPEAGNVKLLVFNILGQEITTLVNETMNAGKYDVQFDASNLPSGIYFYSITTNNFNTIKKMLLIK